MEEGVKREEMEFLGKYGRFSLYVRPENRRYALDKSAPPVHGDELRQLLLAVRTACTIDDAIVGRVELSQCGDCGQFYTSNSRFPELHAMTPLEEVKDLLGRISPGGLVPSGECTLDDCRALCYVVDEPWCRQGMVGKGINLATDQGRTRDEASPLEL